MTLSDGAAMRIVINVPVRLYRELKDQAACEECPVKELRRIKGGLRVRPAGQSRISLPLITSQRPGTLRLDSANIYAVIPLP